MTQHGETVSVCFTAWWEPTTQSYIQMKLMNKPASRQVKRGESEVAREQQAGSRTPNRQLNLTFDFFFPLCELSPGLRLQRSLSPP